MRRKIKKELNKNSKKINRIIKTTNKIKEIQETIGEVELIKKVVSEALYVKGNIAVDLKNFSLTSLPTEKELLR